VIAKAGDLAALLTNLEDRDVLFIDEIHRLNPAVEEILYPAMEDFQLDLIIGEGPAARSVKIDLARFTLVGATTRPGCSPTRCATASASRCASNFYSEAELLEIVVRGARVLGHRDDRGRRARDRPALARHAAHRRAAAAPGARLRRRRRHGADRPRLADRALGSWKWTAAGLDALDHRYLSTIAMNFGGGPVGIETMPRRFSEPRDAIEDIIEPYLIQQGFVQRTPRGRVLTAHAFAISA
jgi:holliday junction DNA helicase RuvB